MVLSQNDVNNKVSVSEKVYDGKIQIIILLSMQIWLNLHKNGFIHISIDDKNINDVIFNLFDQRFS